MQPYFKLNDADKNDKLKKRLTDYCRRAYKKIKEARFKCL